MIRVGIVCGCLPTQAGIAEHELYHQLLAQQLHEEQSEELCISSTWYMTLAESKKKMEELISAGQPGVILFHVRPDPYLRISRLLFRYRDSSNRLRWQLNYNADDAHVQERSYSPRGSLPVRNASILKNSFRDLNYIAAWLFGVHGKAIERWKEKLEEISVTCNESGVQLIMIGPASRPRSKIENFLLKRLETRLASEFKNDRFHYITCFGTFGNGGEKLFLDDGVHVSPSGHRRIAELIFPVMKKYAYTRPEVQALVKPVLP